ncbi:MAG TPA: site-specific integrase [Pseudoneobacillus sp.]|nr:site-specific integrase [Pseudoneobacillus sp.]
MSKRLRIYSDETWAKVHEDNKEVLNDYILELKSKKKSEGTVYQYAADIKMFFCWVCENLDNKPILNLKKRDFRRFFLFLEEKSPARINRVQCSIRNLLEFCTQDDDLYEEYEINVMRSIKGLQKEKVRDIHFLTNDQIELILGHLIQKKQYQRALYLALSYESAGRRNEVHQVLKHKFLDENKTNIVTGKRGKKFPLLYFSRSKEIAKLYLDQRGQDNIDSLWVVGDGEERQPASYETLYNWVMSFRTILQKLTKEDTIEFNPHSLRHSALENYADGTHYVLKEMGKDKLDIKVLKVLANHSDISTTESYLKDKDQEILGEAFGLKL